MHSNFCVGAIIVKDDKFLFGKRSMAKNWHPGVWDLFGGFCMPGENPAGSLRRELEEELGIIVEDFQLVASAAVTENEEFPPIKYFVYFVTSWFGTPVNRGDEHSEIKWFNRGELNKIELASNEYLQLIDKCKSLTGSGK